MNFKFERFSLFLSIVTRQRCIAGNCNASSMAMTIKAVDMLSLTNDVKHLLIDVTRSASEQHSMRSAFGLRQDANRNKRTSLAFEFLRLTVSE